MRLIGAVAVVIPARDAAGTLAGAVDSALRQGVGEVLIAVDPADVQTRVAAERLQGRHDEVKLVDNPDGRAAAGLNACIRSTDATVIARLDAHARFAEGYLQAGLAALAIPGAAVVGGRQHAVGDAPLTRAIAAAMASRLGSGGARHRVGGDRGPAETAYLGVFDRAWLEAVGGFDAELDRNQDYEICHRIRQGGGTVWFEPTMRACYQPRGSLRALAGQYHDYGRWKRRIMVAEPTSVRPRQLAPPLLLLALLGSGGALLAGRRSGLLLPGAYLTAVGGAAALARATTPPALTAGERARAAAVMVVMHLAWGSGFWRGGRGRPARAQRSSKPA